MKHQHFNVVYLPECVTLFLLLMLKYKSQVLLPPLTESNLPCIHIAAWQSLTDPSAETRLAELYANNAFANQRTV